MYSSRLRQLFENFNHTHTDSCAVIGCNVVWRIWSLARASAVSVNKTVRRCLDELNLQIDVAAEGTWSLAELERRHERVGGVKTE